MKKLIIFALLILGAQQAVAQQNLFGKPLLNWRNDPRTSTDVDNLAFVLGNNDKGRMLYDYGRLETRVWNGSSWQILTDTSYVNTRIRNNVSWSSITGKPTFATVATSGSYLDLTNRPTALTAGNGLNITSNQVRLGGTLVAGNTDIIPITGSVLRYRNVGNTADLYNFGTSSFTVGNAGNLVGTTINGAFTQNSSTSDVNFTANNFTTTVNNAISLSVGSSFSVVSTGTLGLTSSSTMTISANSGAGNINVSGLLTANNGLFLNSQRIQQVANPTANQDAATKAYVDGLINTTPQIVLQTAGTNNYSTPTFTAGRPIYFMGSDYPQSAIATQMRTYDRFFLTNPNAPTTLTAGSLSATTATLTWVAPTNRNPDLSVSTTPNVSYRVQYKTTPSGTWLTWGDVSTNTVQLTGLTNNTQYDTRVYAFFDWDFAKGLSDPTAVTQFTTTTASNKQTLINAQTPAYFNYTPNSASLPSQTGITSRNFGTLATGSTSSPTTAQDFSIIFGVNANGSTDNIVIQLDNTGLPTPEVSLRVSATTSSSLAVWLYSNSGLVWNQDVSTNVFNGTYKQVELRKTGSLFEVYVSTGSGAGVQVWSNTFGSFPLDVNRVNLRSGSFGSNFVNMGTNAYVAVFNGTIPSRAQIDAIFAATY